MRSRGTSRRLIRVIERVRRVRLRLLSLCLRAFSEQYVSPYVIAVVLTDLSMLPRPSYSSNPRQQRLPPYLPSSPRLPHLSRISKKTSPQASRRRKEHGTLSNHGTEPSPAKSSSPTSDNASIKSSPLSPSLPKSKNKCHLSHRSAQTRWSRTTSKTGYPAVKWARKSQRQHPSERKGSGSGLRKRDRVWWCWVKVG